ncbi:MAG: nucleotidyltransferase domain-containing protein [Firmicutes bacterium]|nr:nucleotidyltransferase domain-containing protein [Bacillota bacterium]
MKFGLTDKEMERIQRILKEQGVTKCVIFGSRAKGTHKPYSDIDLAIWGETEMGRLFCLLDELPTPYKFDLIKYQEIGNQELKKQIDAQGVVLW